MMKHLSIILSVTVLLLSMYLPCQSLAGRITPEKTELGFNCTASGHHSTAMGDGSTAIGAYSTAIGYGAEASGGYYATAMGYNAVASAYNSTAIGSFTRAGGFSSTAMGHRTTAYSAYETVIGVYSTIYSPASTTEWNGSDRLFVIGNGEASGTRSDAMVVLKNGNVGIGTKEPGARLHIRHSVSGQTPSNVTGLFVENNGNLNDYFVFQTATTGGGKSFSITNAGRVGIGTSSPGYPLEVDGNAAKTSGGTTWINSSDRRLKDITGQYDRGLEQITRLNPVVFYYKEGNPRGLPSDEENIGFVAQEMREVFPEAVSVGQDAYLDFNMHPVNVAVVNAIKELKAENEVLKAENLSLRQDIELIKEVLGL